MQNASIEHKNGSIGKELLDAYLLYSLYDIRLKAEIWRLDCNYERSFESLGNVPQVEYPSSIYLEN